MKLGYCADIEQLTFSNREFRRVLFTTDRTELAVMCVRPDGVIGPETHDADQFVRCEAGRGEVMLGGTVQKLLPGYGLVVPAGVAHRIKNLSLENTLRLYTVSSPPRHRDGDVQALDDDAERALGELERNAMD